MADDIFKVAVSVPADFMDILMDAIDEVIDPIYPGYRRSFSIMDVVGTWIPVEGSDPYIGEIDTITRVEEKRIEFAVRDYDLPQVLHVIDNIHPYEEPAVDVISMKAWRSYL
jgi:hypothetical protein